MGIDVIGARWLELFRKQAAETVTRGKVSLRKKRRQQRRLARVAMIVHKFLLRTEPARSLLAVKQASVARDQKIQMRRHVKKYGTAREFAERNLVADGGRPQIVAEGA